MHKTDHNIKEILRTGFAAIPVDDCDVERVTAQIMEQCRAKVSSSKTVLPFSRHGAGRLYALAASLVLVCGAGYLFFSRFTPVVNTCLDPTSMKPGLKVLSAITDTGAVQTDTACRISELSTDERSQMLLSIGRRTRSILFERSDIKIGRIDTMHTSVALNRGTIAVEVAPGGDDTVTVATRFGTFTQIGTRFAVTVDTLRGGFLEVYRGRVRVTYADNIDTVLKAGETWSSFSADKVTPVGRDSAELHALDLAFNTNRLNHIIKLQPVKLQPASVRKRPTTPQRSSGAEVPIFKPEKVDTTAVVISRMAQKGDLHSIDSILAELDEHSDFDEIARILLSTGQSKKEIFRFAQARELFNMVATKQFFSRTNRENGWIQKYTLKKTVEEAPAQDLLQDVRDYQKHFSDGAFSDDMAAEAVSLLMALKRYNRVVGEIERLLKAFPDHPQREYYLYVYPTILREQLRRPEDALAAYKRYIASFPSGRYEEDALFRTIQLSHLAKKPEEASTYIQKYLNLYPNGRWVGEIRSIQTAGN